MAVALVAAFVSLTLLVGCSDKVDLSDDKSERAPATTVSTGPEHP